MSPGGPDCGDPRRHRRKIRADGGRAETAVVDALDAAAVNDHADAVVRESGGIDISVNVITQKADFGSLIDISCGTCGD